MSKPPKSAVIYELLGSLFGWVWLLSIPVTLFFIVRAIWFDGGWAAVLIIVGIGAVCKWLLRGFEENKARVYREANMRADGHREEETEEH